MLTSTLLDLRCPRNKKGNELCGSELSLFSGETLKASNSAELVEVISGELECKRCKSRFPILSGVAVLVDDVRFYLMSHVKGIAQAVSDAQIPAQYRKEFLEAKSEIESEHIEEDLEAERVVSLYFMNHYLRVAHADSKAPWWKPGAGRGSPLIDQLVRDHWDHGPFEQIKKWITKIAAVRPVDSVIELGCGLGGLYLELKPHVRRYLGVDSSFASVAMGRHLALGVPYRGKIRIPRDLLQGPVSADSGFTAPKSKDFEGGRADLVVGDLENLPIHRGAWDLAVALNTIDMLPEPSLLPDLQRTLTKKDGLVIQSCPYIWHEGVAAELRKRVPKGISDSARAVEWLYEQAGFEIQEKVEDLPWLFFKHVRQLEIYSVHMFMARSKKS